MAEQIEGLEVETAVVAEATEKVAKVQTAEEKAAIESGAEMISLLGLGTTIDKFATVVASLKDADETAKKDAKETLVASFGASVNDVRIAVKASAEQIEKLKNLQAAVDATLAALKSYDKEPKPEKVKAEKAPKIKGGVIMTVKGGLDGKGDENYMIAKSLVKEATDKFKTDAQARRAFIFTDENFANGLVAKTEIPTLAI